MDRLTYKTPNVPAVPVTFALDFALYLDDETWHGLSAIFERLAEYESTGYNPVDFDKLCRGMSDLRMALGLDTYEDLQKIIQDDRLLVLPCAIGTPVFMHEQLCKNNPYTDCKYSQDCRRDPFIKCPLRAVERTFTVDMRERLGKSLWLTKEEAEAAIPADRRP